MINVEKFMRYEDGQMDEEEFTEFFQELVDSGKAWRLQGHYGRTAMALIENGVIEPPPNFR